MLSSTIGPLLYWMQMGSNARHDTCEHFMWQLQNRKSTTATRRASSGSNRVVGQRRELQPNVVGRRVPCLRQRQNVERVIGS